MRTEIGNRESEIVRDFSLCDFRFSTAGFPVLCH